MEPFHFLFKPDRVSNNVLISNVNSSNELRHELISNVNSSNELRHELISNVNSSNELLHEPLPNNRRMFIPIVTEPSSVFNIMFKMCANVTLSQSVLVY